MSILDAAYEAGSHKSTDKTIKDGELNKNDVITQTFQKAKDGNGRLHLAVGPG